MKRYSQSKFIREYLTIDEVKQLIRAKCGNETVKRAFLFSCNCGLRLSDVRALKWKDIYSDYGTWKVATRMKKTENVVYIPLPRTGIEEWLPGIERNADSNVFPDLTPYALSKVSEAMGVKEAANHEQGMFHTTRPRHTYATMPSYSWVLTFILYQKLLGAHQYQTHTTVCKNHSVRKKETMQVRCDRSTNL